ncbi:TerB family tellurite resistance protein [Myxococcota bacterium]|nr:TerB family tellurite resistance protein [Myxococcota bacterium]
MDTNDKIQICSVVCQAILIDGQLTDTERAYLAQLMDNYGLNDEDKKQVQRRNIDDDVREMASQIQSPEAKTLVLREVAKVINVDGELTKVENRLLHRVAEGIGFNEEQMTEALSS